MIKKVSDKKKALLRAIKIIGTQQKLAQKLGIYQPTISNWLRRPQGMPACYAIPIEKLTHGKVKRWELRPDFYPPKEYKTGDKKYD